MAKAKFNYIWMKAGICFCSKKNSAKSGERKDQIFFAVSRRIEDTKRHERKGCDSFPMMFPDHISPVHSNAFPRHDAG